MDRIDIQLNIQTATKAQIAISRNQNRPRSIELRKAVVAARGAASERLRATNWKVNAQVPGAVLRDRFALAPAVMHKLDAALDAAQISMRGYDRCLRLAWTIADLAGKTVPGVDEVAKAIYLRGHLGSDRLQ